MNGLLHTMRGLLRPIRADLIARGAFDFPTRGTVRRIKTNEFVRRVYGVAEARLAEGGSVMQDVWDLFIQLARDDYLGETLLRMCQRKITAHLPYIVKAYLAPTMTEFHCISVGVVLGTDLL